MNEEQPTSMRITVPLGSTVVPLIQIASLLLQLRKPLSPSQVRMSSILPTMGTYTAWQYWTFPMLSWPLVVATKPSRFVGFPRGNDYTFKYSFQIWACSAEGTTLLTTFEFTHGAVLALTAKGDTLYAGCQDGYVKVLDLETQTLIRTIIVHEVNLAFPEVRSGLSQFLVRGYLITVDDWIRSVHLFSQWVCHGTCGLRNVLNSSHIIIALVIFIRLYRVLESPRWYCSVIHYFQQQMYAWFCAPLGYWRQ